MNEYLAVRLKVVVSGWTGFWTLTLEHDGATYRDTFSNKKRPGIVQIEGFLARCGYRPD